MKLIKPVYFDTFRCIAASCPDSCCKEWDVLVDADKAAYYRSLILGETAECALKIADGLCVKLTVVAYISVLGKLKFFSGDIINIKLCHITSPPF